MTLLLNGFELAKQCRAELAEKIRGLGFQPKLVVIQIGDNPASTIYVRNKEKAAKEIGIDAEVIRHKEFSQKELLNLINQLNGDLAVDGILVQLPLPEGFNEKEILQAIDPAKDVDGFHVENAGKVSLGKFDEAFVPCTPMGVVELLKRNGIEIAGKHVVIVGRSNLVGKPEALLMLSEDATVTVCHSKTPDLSAMTKQADILISAVGRKHTIHADMIKEGCVVVDVGINRTETGICGDVDFDECLGKASAMTPVPGGVGPMTIAMLLKNTMKAYRLHEAR